MKTFNKCLKTVCLVIPTITNQTFEKGHNFHEK